MVSELGESVPLSQPECGRLCSHSLAEKQEKAICSAIAFFCPKIIPKDKTQEHREKTPAFQSLRRGILNLGPCWGQI